MFFFTEASGLHLPHVPRGKMMMFSCNYESSMSNLKKKTKLNFESSNLTPTLKAIMIVEFYKISELLSEETQVSILVYISASSEKLFFKLQPDNVREFLSLSPFPRIKLNSNHIEAHAISVVRPYDITTSQIVVQFWPAAQHWNRGELASFKHTRGFLQDISLNLSMKDFL